MKTAIAITAFAIMAMSCAQPSGPANTNAANTAPATAPDRAVGTEPIEPEKAELTAEQQAVIAGGTETKWTEEELSWTLPKDWKKLKIIDRLFKYGPSDSTFIYATTLNLNEGFDTDASLKSTYAAAVAKVESGEYELARMLEIDGVRGVEWIEAMPAEDSGPRRHQWIAFRTRGGKTQQLNVILTAPGTDFEKRRSEFAAVMYSMRIAKQAQS